MKFRAGMIPRKNRLTNLLMKLCWYVKQLVPLKYDTTYGENDKRYVSVWRMWFGRCFAIKTYEIA